MSLKQRIRGARQKASLAANAERIRLYHDIGREILERQRHQRWGAKVIDRLSADLRAAFPDMKGLSGSNLVFLLPRVQIGDLVSSLLTNCLGSTLSPLSPSFESP